MPDSITTELNFARPPVVETRIAVQFSPLNGFRSGHFGLFWTECLDDQDWQIAADESADATEKERFGTIHLSPPDLPSGLEDYPAVQMNLVSKDSSQSIKFQPNKLKLSWKRDGQKPRYADVKRQFVALFEKLEAFAEKHALATPKANLWEITYVNAIRSGELWSTPAEWHEVLPGIFPAGGPQLEGYPWTTFNGEWFFEIPDRTGRVRVRVQKAVKSPSEEIVLLLVISARGEVGEASPLDSGDWSRGLDIGHEAAGCAIRGLASRKALDAWGLTR